MGLVLLLAAAAVFWHLPAVEAGANRTQKPLVDSRQKRPPRRPVVHRSPPSAKGSRAVPPPRRPSPGNSSSITPPPASQPPSPAHQPQLQPPPSPSPRPAPGGGSPGPPPQQQPVRPPPAVSPGPSPGASPSPSPSPRLTGSPPPHPSPGGGPAPAPSHAEATYAPYASRTDGDEILVLTVQLDKRSSGGAGSSSGGTPPGQEGSNSPPGDSNHRDGTTVVDDEQRLYFSVRPEGTGQPLPGAPTPLVYRRLLFSEPADPQEVAALETGDLVFHKGVERRPAAVAAAAGRRSSRRQALLLLSASEAGGAAAGAADEVLGSDSGGSGAGGSSSSGSGNISSSRRRTEDAAAGAELGAAQEPDLVSGVDLDWDSDFFNATYLNRKANSFYNDKARVPDLLAALGKPTDVTSVTLILNVCGVNNTVTPEQLDKYYFGSANGTSGGGGGSDQDGPTLKNFFDTCSHGYAPFKRELNRILGPIDVPCAAAPSSGRPFDSSRGCTDRELFGWAQWALDWVAQNAPDVPLSRYESSRRLFLLPDLPACAAWTSLASVGCSANCPVFLKVADDATPRELASQLMHDLGHTYSFSHAGAVASAVGADLPPAPGPRADTGCPMGSASEAVGLVCPNAANAWKVGWATLLDETAQVNTAQQLATFKLPPASARDASLVQVAVTPEWRGDDSQHTSYYYISYRMSPALPATPPAAEGADGGGAAAKLDPGLYDAGLDASLDVKVFIHQYDGLTVRMGSPYKPVLVGSSGYKTPENIIVMPEQAMKYFKVRVADPDFEGAPVTVCTSPPGGMPLGEQPEPGNCDLCYDGVDNDCNGAVDSEDASCAGCF
ncbi:hypothetical protein HXX76_007451 [Chlamydomonas incerta]|uniref:Peptidase M11 gametolysin domain-containing protein n=1 Tax=Chlamydomonas incerta TaxID=51695 RepID=A0A835T7T2_CHLIN|nr:hypothetical protein HXX76_007451 [Chlamydomonas incerta]|eukprot:KAG2435379.1 hypothetical protein HXX76_007451 [Chlamydomonas incerta]